MQQLAGKTPDDRDYLSLIEPKLRDLQERLLTGPVLDSGAFARQRRRRTDNERQPWAHRLPPAAAAGLEELAPVNLLVPAPENRRASSSRTCSVWGGPLPPGIVRTPAGRGSPRHS